MELWHLASLFLSYTMLTDLIVAGESKDQTFFVQPGGAEIHADIELEGYKCIFTYAAQGGTNEEWSMSVIVNNGGAEVSCSVERGIPSYLFFEKFTLKMTGPDVALSDSVAMSAQAGHNLLGVEEYKLNEDSITSVPGKFQNKLEKVGILSTRTRKEL